MDSLYLQAARSVILSSVIDLIWISLNFLNSWISTRLFQLIISTFRLTPSNIKGLFIWSQYTGISRLPETYFMPGLYDLDTPACPGWPGCVYSVNKIVEKLLIICRSKENKFWSHINSIPKNVVSFCFLFLEVLPSVSQCFKFQFTSSPCTGILRLYGQAFVPLDRDLNCFYRDQVRLDVPVSI